MTVYHRIETRPLHLRHRRDPLRLHQGRRKFAILVAPALFAKHLVRRAGEGLYGKFEVQRLKHRPQQGKADLCQ